MTEPRAVTRHAIVRGGAGSIGVEPYDSPAVQALFAAMMADIDERYAADGPADGDSPEIVESYMVRAEQLTPPQGVVLVARLGGEAVGCGAVRPLIRGPADVAEIKRMYTAPAARRHGVSRALLGRLETEAAALGYRRVQLETGLRQPEAIRLYESAGYHLVPGFGQYAGDELTVCYARDLPTP